MSTTLYGIKNCDTVRAARKWLDEHGVDYRFHDVRDEALTSAQLTAWLDEIGLELINKRSTTWKSLTLDEREGLDQKSAVALLQRNPTLMKRPLLDTGNSRHLGYKPAQYAQLFAHHTL